MSLAGLLAPATLIMAMDRTVVTVTAPTLQMQFHLTLPQLGLVFSAFFWAYAIMQIPAGAMVERVGPRLALFIAIMLWSAMTALTPFAGSFAGLLLVRVLLGAGQSADWPASIVAINRLFRAETRAGANAVLLCALYAGPVVGAPLAAYLLDRAGPHSLFLVCGGLGVAFAMIWWAFYRDASHSFEDERPRQMLARRVAGSKRAWALAGAYACTASLGSFYLSLFPTYLSQDRGVELGRLGSYSAISSAALCLAALLAGPILAHIYKRSNSPAAARLPVAISALVVVTVLSLAAPWLASDRMTLLAACGSLAAIGFSQVTTWSVVQDIGGEDTGPLTGLINLIGNLAAGAMPLIAAVLVDETGGWTASLTLLAAVAACGCIFWLFVNPNLRLELRQTHSDAQGGKIAAPL